MSKKIRVATEEALSSLRDEIKNLGGGNLIITDNRELGDTLCGGFDSEYLTTHPFFGSMVDNGY